MDNQSDQFDVGIGPLLTQLEQIVNGLIGRIPYIIFGIIVFVAALWLSGRLGNWVRGRFGNGKLSDEAGIAFGRIVRGVVAILGVVIAMIIIFPGLNVGALLGSLGVGGVVIGFAFRDILQNFFAGMIILLTEPFNIGDQIIVDGYEGTVRKIDLRATTIHAYDGRDIIIPNSELFIDSVMVNTAHDTRRSQYDIGIGYGDDIERARQAILEAVQQCEGVLSDPAPDVLVWELADFSVVMRTRWWTESKRADIVRISDRVLTAVKYRLDEEGIDMPFPTQVTLFHDQTEETDGDRTQQREGWPQASDGNNPQPLRIAGALGRKNGSGTRTSG